MLRKQFYFKLKRGVIFYNILKFDQVLKSFFSFPLEIVRDYFDFIFNVAGRQLPNEKKKSP